MKKWWLIALMFVSLSAISAELREMYVVIPTTPEYPQQTELVITNQPCEKWHDDKITLYYAYALNTVTGEKITGCWQGGEVIRMELSDDRGNLFHYNIFADNFVLKSK